MKYLKVINNLLFPTKNLCYFCRERYNNIEEFLCNNCKEFLEKCNREINVDSNYIKTVYYSLIYNRFIKEVVKDFKFNGKSYLYKPLGEIMIETVDLMKLYDVDLIFYVPSHRKKEAIRGYNQSQLLGNYIGKSLDIPVSHNNLMKIRMTKDQSHLNKLSREDNLIDSFKLRDKTEVYNKNVLLVDDIITTGSTMIECSKVLMENEAREVIGLALTSSKKL